MCASVVRVRTHPGARDRRRTKSRWCAPPLTTRAGALAARRARREPGHHARRAGIGLARAILGRPHRPPAHRQGAVAGARRAPVHLIAGPCQPTRARPPARRRQDGDAGARGRARRLWQDHRAHRMGRARRATVRLGRRHGDRRPARAAAVLDPHGLGPDRAAVARSDPLGSGPARTLADVDAAPAAGRDGRPPSPRGAGHRRRPRAARSRNRRDPLDAHRPRHRAVDGRDRLSERADGRRGTVARAGRRRRAAGRRAGDERRRGPAGALPRGASSWRPPTSPRSSAGPRAGPPACTWQASRCSSRTTGPMPSGASPATIAWWPTTSATRCSPR
jgi:hypothetical protein